MFHGVLVHKLSIWFSLRQLLHMGTCITGSAKLQKSEKYSFLKIGGFRKRAFNAKMISKFCIQIFCTIWVLKSQEG